MSGLPCAICNGTTAHACGCPAYVAPTPFSHYKVRRPEPEPEPEPGHKGSINPGFCCLICGAGFDFGCNCPDE